MLILILLISLSQILSQSVNLVPLETIVTCDIAPCIVIGFTYPATGSLIIEGNDMKDGYQYWANLANENGIPIGSDVYHVELVAYDDSGDSSQTEFLYRELVFVDQVDFLLGPFGSSHGKKANLVSWENDMVIVLSNSASQTVYEEGYDHIFAVLSTTDEYATSSLEKLKSVGAESFSIIHSTNIFTTETAESVKQWIHNYNLTLLGDLLTYDSENFTYEELDDLVRTCRDLNPDVLLGIGRLVDGEFIIESASEIEWTPKAFWMTSSVGNPDFIEELGSEADLITGAVQWHKTALYIDDLYNFNSTTYHTKYLRDFEEEPSYISAQATAAGIVLDTAIRQLSNISNQSELKSILSSIDITTFYAPVKFNSAGENIAKQMLMIQIQDGTVQVVAPADEQTSSLIYPATSQSQPSTSTSPLLILPILSSLIFLL